MRTISAVWSPWGPSPQLRAFSHALFKRSPKQYFSRSSGFFYTRQKKIYTSAAHDKYEVCVKPIFLALRIFDWWTLSGQAASEKKEEKCFLKENLIGFQKIPNCILHPNISGTEKSGCSKIIDSKLAERVFFTIGKRPPSPPPPPFMRCFFVRAD